MLMRTDPFREFDRLTQQVLGGVSPDSVDIDVERNVLTVKAERPGRNSEQEMVAAHSASPTTFLPGRIGAALTTPRTATAHITRRHRMR